MPFLDSLDIANRSCQILGAEQIASPTEDSVQNFELSFAYDKLRQPELQTNVWSFATRKAVLRAIDPGTMILTPKQWDATVTYLPGAIVSDANGQNWISTQEQNINNPPGGNNDVWDSYYGPLTVTLWDTTAQTAYYAGELVYIPGTGVGTGPDYNGGYQIYMSLINGNQDTPNVSTPWANTTVYYGGQQVSYNGAQYVSLIEYNVGNTPQTAVPDWLSTTVYSIGNQVAGSDNFIYTALTNNSNADPTLDDGINWLATNVPNAWALTNTHLADIKWMAVSATMKNLLIPYPIGSGPSYQTYTRNAFRLPSGFLKVAPQQPKAGSVSILGAPTGAMYLDWTFEDEFLLTHDNGPIVLRFVADVVNVQKFHALFCEALASRMAFETCEKVTQSTGKVQIAGSKYKMAIASAREQNAIENGADEPPMDDYISCRL